MARCLASYMACPRAIQRAIVEQSLKPPSLPEIRDMREKHLRSRRRAPEPPFKLHEGYYPADAYEKAAAVSARFLAALARERGNPRHV